MLTKKTESKTVYLEAKHFRLWQKLDKYVPGCDTIEVTNPKTQEKLTKHGFSFESMYGRALKLIKYDTEKKFATRFFGFKLTVVDNGEFCVLDMPYHSQVLRRFLKAAPNFDWELSFKISIFKTKKDDGTDTTGIWFQQDGRTIKPHWTRDNPGEMPEPIFYKEEDKWDYGPQHRWLVEQLQSVTIPAIDTAAASIAPPEKSAEVEEIEAYGEPPAGPIDDSDVPF
jgi:hypothetical protein